MKCPSPLTITAGGHPVPVDAVVTATDHGSPPGASNWNSVEFLGRCPISDQLSADRASQRRRPGGLHPPGRRNARVVTSRLKRDAGQPTASRSRPSCNRPTHHTCRRRSRAQHSRRNPRTMCSRTTGNPTDSNSNRPTARPLPYRPWKPAPSTGRQSSSPSPEVRQSAPREQTWTWNLSRLMNTGIERATAALTHLRRSTIGRRVRKVRKVRRVRKAMQRILFVLFTLFHCSHSPRRSAAAAAVHRCGRETTNRRWSRAQPAGCLATVPVRSSHTPA